MNDFDAVKDKVGYKDLEEIDKWVLLRAHRLIERVTKAYDEFEFHLVFHSIHDFCVNDLSAFYFDVTKDRLYCETKDGKLRRSSQTAMNEILHIMVRLFAPVLSFTAEDIWKHIKKSEILNPKSEINPKYQIPNNSIFEEKMPEVDKKLLDEKLESKWDKLLGIRSEVYKVFENARAEKSISHPLEARVEALMEGEDYKLLKDMEPQLPSLFIVSEFLVSKGSRNITVKKAEGKKCERCWMHLKSVGANSKHPTLCERCAGVVG